MKKLTGWHQDQIAGRHYEQILHPLGGSKEGESSVLRDHLPLSPSIDSNRYRIITVRDSSHQEQPKHVGPDVISILSHELLSPLALIKGYTATLLHLGDATTEKQKRKYIRGIDSATNKLSRLLENFRDISRLESSAPNLAMESTSLPGLLRKTISGIQGQTTKHVIKLRLFRPLPPVNVNSQKIEQVVTNLLVNAIRYSPQGGDIEVSIKRALDKEKLREILGEISKIKPPCLIVTVTDHGVGIPEEDLEQIFDKFYRVDNRLTRASSGAGLGLYICKIIVEVHGGHIWARSSVGTGSTFGFSLPVDLSALRKQE
jgi:signal transduction histidine kinase